jgi:hypothetical protein
MCYSKTAAHHVHAPLAALLFRGQPVVLLFARSDPGSPKDSQRGRTPVGEREPLSVREPLYAGYRDQNAMIHLPVVRH